MGKPVKIESGESVFQLALAHSGEAVQTLVEIMRSGDSDKTKLMAAMAVLEYARRASASCVIDVPMNFDAPARIGPEENLVSDSDKAALREARVKVLEEINQHPGNVFTAPMLAERLRIQKHLIGPVLAKLVSDGHVVRGGPGMFKAKSQGAA